MSQIPSRRRTSEAKSGSEAKRDHPEYPRFLNLNPGLFQAGFELSVPRHVARVTSGYQDGRRRDKRAFARYEARKSALAKRFQ